MGREMERGIKIRKSDIERADESKRLILICIPMA